MARSELDTKAFAKELLAAVKPHAKDALDHAKDLRERWDAYESALEKTLEAIQKETDPARRAGLLQDLERALPARKKAITSAAASVLASDAAATFDAALEVATKVAIAAAKTLI